MINELKAMAIFAEVVKNGSFNKAAKLLTLSPSVVSYHITQLEKKTGSALLYRSTRKLTLSHEGEVFYQQVLQMLAAANKGMNLLAESQNEPAGKITLSLPTALSISPINDVIAEFATKHPKVTINLHFSDSNSDNIDDKVDLIIRAGQLKDSDLKAVQLGMIKRQLVCSPDYYQKHIPPTVPTDLTTWLWLKLAQLPNKRTFLSSSSSQEVEFNSQISVNSVEAIYQYCLRGNGLAVLAKSQVHADLESGKLIPVLPHWQVESLPLYALWPNNLKETSVTKILLSSIKALDHF